MVPEAVLRMAASVELEEALARRKVRAAGRRKAEAEEQVPVWELRTASVPVLEQQIAAAQEFVQ